MSVCLSLPDPVMSNQPAPEQGVVLLNSGPHMKSKKGLEAGKVEGLQARGQWASKAEFLLAVAGQIIGLGNVWRFPYLCYKNGGGVFFVPYLLFLVLCGVPLFLMETSLGQYTSLGGVSAWRSICPLFGGLGFASQVMILHGCVYYIVVLAWALFYLVHSFQSELPWAHCNNTWNTDTCVLFDCQNLTSGTSLPENATSPVIEFWEREVLQLSSGPDELGPVSWRLALCLLLVWVVCYFCVWKGVKSTGKVVYLTTTFPYLMLAILLVRGITLPGASQGIVYYLNPNITRLADPQGLFFPVPAEQWHQLPGRLCHLLCARLHGSGAGCGHRRCGPVRPWAGLYSVPSGCSHDASPSAVGCVLLPHDHHAGAGHTVCEPGGPDDLCD